MSETIDVDVRIDQTVNVDLHISDVVAGINNAPMKRRWNYIASIINGIEVDLSEMTDEQKAVIKKYLTDKLNLFS